MVRKIITIVIFCLLAWKVEAGPCEAYFTFEVDGNTIFLNGSSTAGEVVSWHWYINNDLFSDNGPQTDVVVNEPGEYQLCLVIETASGCTDTFCHGILVPEPQGDCEAHFTWTVEGFTIFLNGSSSTGGDVVSWHWYINNDLFSDNGPQTDVVVNEPGEYQLCLVIETASGCTDTFCHGILVPEPQGDCEAHFTWTVEGFTIFLNGSSSTGGDVVSWHWYINNDLFSDNGPQTDVVVNEPGEYQLCLVIETASGCTDTFCHGILVPEPQGDCEAHFTWTVEGFTIFLNGSSSTGGDVVSWHWYINNDLFSDNGPQTDVVVNEPGEYQLCLVIETASGCTDTFCHGILVPEPQGDCEAHFTWNVEGFTIFLNGSSSTGGDVVSWHWYINNDLFSNNGPQTDVVVNEPGEYQLCLVIETASGCTDTFCHGILVPEPQGDCEAHFTWTVEGFTIFLNGSSSTGGDVVSWHWYINNDLFSDNGPQTDVVVNEPGEYQLCLVIETASGCTDTFCHEVIIEGLLDQQNAVKILTPGLDETINLMITAAATGTIRISLSEITGRKIYSRQDNMPTGSKQYVIAFNEQLSIGIYLISVQFSDGSVLSEKFTILN